MLVEQMRVGPMAVFSYIVGCEKKKEGLIIDPAGSVNKIISKAADMELRIKYVVNTHGHADHTCGNRAVLSKTGSDLVVHEEDAKEIIRGLNRAFSMVMGKRPSPEAHTLLNDGDFIKIGETGLKVIHTPGHSPGSICLYGEGNLFTGDTLLWGRLAGPTLKAALLTSCSVLSESCLPCRPKPGYGRDTIMATRLSQH